MQEKEKVIRLSKAARDFNISLDQIIEFLASQGFEIQRNPNFKLTNTMYGLLDLEFGEFDEEEIDPNDEDTDDDSFIDDYETDDENFSSKDNVNLDEYLGTWELIIDNAKTKFDYKSFLETLSGLPKTVTDNILFLVIIAYASNKSNFLIAAELFNEILMLGYVWELESIKEFVNDKDEVFSLEIFLSGLATGMIKNGSDSTDVLLSISQLLNKKEPRN